MNITVEREPNCEARLRVEVPAEAVKEQRKEIVRAFRNQARIPGFRAGKVPPAVIEKRYGEQIAEELETRLLQKAYKQASEREDLHILKVRELDDSVAHPDGALSLSILVTLLPEFELPDYKGITLEIPDYQIGDTEIEAELQSFRARFGTFNDITGRPLQKGDFAVIDYSARLDGKPLEEALGQSVGYLAGGTDHWLQMKEDSLLPGFSAALEGATPGQERDFPLEVPEDFPVEELRGATLEYHAALKEIKEQVLPDLDDALADQIMSGKTLAELREAVREDLESNLTRKLGEFKVQQLLERLSQGVEFDLPAELVTAETQGQADEMVERGMGSGMSESEIEARQGEIFAAAGQRARMNLRTEFLLQRIAEAEELEVGEAELGRQVAAYAKQAGKSVKAFARELDKSGRLSGLRHQLLLGKTIDFLLEHAKVETILPPPSPDDDSQS